MLEGFLLDGNVDHLVLALVFQVQQVLIEMLDLSDGGHSSADGCCLHEDVLGLVSYHRSSIELVDLLGEFGGDWLLLALSCRRLLSFDRFGSHRDLLG